MKLALLFLPVIAAAGCGPRGDGPVPIHAGTPCARCGMEIRSLKFACERVEAGRARCYDALECLRAGERANPAGRAYVPDYDSERLLPLDSVWVAHGRFPTPMGGGFAAFATRDAAEQVARQTQGEVQSGTEWWRAPEVESP